MTTNDFLAFDRASRAQPLQLKLLHSHGRTAEGTLALPAAGTGLASALALGGERLNAAQWEDADRCRIAWDGAGRGWRLSHGSRAVVCAVNGQRVAVHAEVPLVAGDVLEIGWQRFALQAAAETPDATAPEAMKPAPSGAVPAAVPSAAAQATPPGTPPFDLRDLGFPGPLTSALDDPFGVLGIAGAEPRSMADPLADLLGEAPSRAAMPDVSDHAVPNASGGLLESLHLEFDRVVRDPTQLTGRADWEASSGPGFEPPPSLEELSRQAAPYPLLRDILEPREHIDQLISGFHPLARPTLLDPDRAEEVLHLFASPQMRAAPPAVPGLTRREHHDLSPDSHMRFDVFQPDANKESLP